MPKISPSIFGTTKIFSACPTFWHKNSSRRKNFRRAQYSHENFHRDEFFSSCQKIFWHAQFFFQHAEKIFGATNFFSAWRKFFGHDEFFFGAPKILMKFSARRKKLGAPKNSARKTNRVTALQLMMKAKLSSTSYKYIGTPSGVVSFC